MFKSLSTMAMLLMATMLCLCGLTGCGGSVDAKAIDAPLRAMLDRHDAYVSADVSLKDIDKSVYLRTSDLMRHILDVAEKKTAPATVAPVTPTAAPTSTAEIVPESTALTSKAELYRQLAKLTIPDKPQTPQEQYARLEALATMIDHDPGVQNSIAELASRAKYEAPQTATADWPGSLRANGVSAGVRW